LVASLAIASGCSSAKSRSLDLVAREYPAPFITAKGTEVGISSWYGPGFHGNATASGERYDQEALTAAHRSLPLGTWIDVRNLTNDRIVRVRVNDRGPYKHGRVLDLSYAAARALDMVGRGTTDVEIRLADARYRVWPAVRYSVQVGAFRTRAEADATGQAVASEGESAYLKLTGRADYPFSVRVGPFVQRADAVAATDRLKERRFRALLVEEDPPADVFAERPPSRERAGSDRIATR
jgi:rare lipoprotein A